MLIQSGMNSSRNRYSYGTRGSSLSLSSSLSSLSSSSCFWISTAAYATAVPLLASWAVPLVLGAVTLLRQRIQQTTNNKSDDSNHRNNNNNDDGNDGDDDDKTTLLTGRVWHTRFHPIRHSFTYPLFMFGVDLTTVQKDSNNQKTVDQSFNEKLWPLSLIMKFSTKHHLINGEGRDGDDDDDDLEKPLYERIYSLIEQRTMGYLKPTRTTHAVWLVTHLEYYGYCFNPVSFYYLFHRETGRMQAIVAEVSNTPWIEMYPYVLHPTSSDKVRYSRTTKRTTTTSYDGGGGGDEEATAMTNYKFPKTFHVSPFMEMSYMYDWDFAGEDKVFANSGTGTTVPSSNNDDRHTLDFLYVRTAMRRQPKQQPPTQLQDGSEDHISNDELQFTATMRLRAIGLHPLTLAWQLARYPSYCLIVQIWIHYEAFWLFMKGVAYQPHPQGAETTASRIIGALMTPLFELQSRMMKIARRGSDQNAPERQMQSTSRSNDVFGPPKDG